MNISFNDLLDRAEQPMYQAILAFIGVVTIILGGELLAAFGLSVSERFAWVVATAFLLVFALFNSVSSLASKDLGAFMWQSIVSFAALAAVSGLLAYLVSGLSITNAGSYRWLYGVMSFGYLVFLAIMTTIRRLYKFFEEDEKRTTDGKGSTQRRGRPRR